MEKIEIVIFFLIYYCRLKVKETFKPPKMTDAVIHGLYKGSEVKMLAPKPTGHKTSVEVLAAIQIRTGKLQKIDAGAKALNELDQMKVALEKFADKFPKGDFSVDEGLAHLGLCESECKFLKFSEMSGVAFHRTWFVNLALILKLKLIKNDGENGWKITPA
jgi:hypothetical protein